MSLMTDAAGPQWSSLQPPADITGGLFSRGRDFTRTHPLLTDILLAAALLAPSTVWLAGSPFASAQAAIVQAALVATVAVRRAAPVPVFAVACGIAFAQWLLGYPLLGDAALLIGLYTVAAHQPRLQAGLAAGLLEAGAVLAALKFDPADTKLLSLLFLSATVIAALFAGLATASGSRYLAWMDERARRLAVERDQQAELAAAGERTRIARDLHDIVSPGPGREAMADVSEAGRQALSDMRAMLGVLRTDEPPADLTPQPGLDQLGPLVERVRGTGLAVSLDFAGTPFPLGAAAGLTAYRVVQEALTNTIRHAGARQARVTVRYDAPCVGISVSDDGTAGPAGGSRGHGIDGMRERAALHDGTVTAGPAPDGGWLVCATLRPGAGAAAR